MHGDMTKYMGLENEDMNYYESYDSMDIPWELYSKSESMRKHCETICRLYTETGLRIRA